MINKEKDLEQLHSELTQKLLEKIRNPKVTASELNVARQFLKDNGCESIAVDNSPLKSLVDSLPFEDSETPLMKPVELAN
jgi:hypothetical protein|tara:strand:+ start:848 stop:1087 length:240 start_codon:yes stop_codon:yes gene_type:complete